MTVDLNIEAFSGELNSKNGVLKTNRFQVIFPTPPIMAGRSGVSNIPRTMHFWCQDVQIPGYQISPGNIRRWTYGPNEVRPVAPNMQQIQLNFTIDGDMENWSYFSAWMQSIVPHDGDGLIDTQSSFSNGRPYELSYKSEYATTIHILVFDDKQTEEPISTVEIQEAFPSNMNAVPLAWGQNDAYATFSVFIDYLTWKQTKNSITSGFFET